MESKKNELLIKPAKNGFLVYVDYEFSSTSLKPIPYVFETMESLLNFVENNIIPFNEERLKYQIKDSQVAELVNAKSKGWCP